MSIHPGVHLYIYFGLHLYVSLSVHVGQSVAQSVRRYLALMFHSVCRWKPVLAGHGDVDGE